MNDGGFQIRFSVKCISYKNTVHTAKRADKAHPSKYYPVTNNLLETLNLISMLLDVVGARTLQMLQANQLQPSQPISSIKNSLGEHQCLAK